LEEFLVVSFEFSVREQRFRGGFLNSSRKRLTCLGKQRGLEGDLKIKRGAPADGLARLFDFAPTSKMPEL